MKHFYTNSLMNRPNTERRTLGNENQQNRYGETHALKSNLFSMRKRVVVVFMLLVVCLSGTVWGQTINMQNGSTVLTCGQSVTFYDDGGTGNYGNSHTYVYTFEAPGDIIIRFSSFATENTSSYDYDNIKIYDGDLLTGTPYVFGCTGYTSLTNAATGFSSLLSINTDYTCNSGKMTIVWKADGSSNAAGWVATVTCQCVTMYNGLTRHIACGQSIKFYDDGGPNGDYSSINATHTATFTADGPITINFSSLEAEGGSWDYMNVYDGTAVEANNLYGGNISSTPSGSVTAESGTLIIKWKADGSVVKAGWDATITANCPSCDVVGTLDPSQTISSSPVYGLYKNSWVQMIYTADEIGDCCTITGISFFSKASNSKVRATKVYVALTDKTQFANATTGQFVSSTSMTKVWEGNWTIVAGENNFTFTQPFNYDDCDKNLLIAFDCDATEYASTSFYGGSTSNSMVIAAYNDSQNPPDANMSTWSSSMYTYTTRPVIKICKSCPEPIEECEGFEGGAMPSGWSSEGSSTWIVGTGNASVNSAHDGSYNAKITHLSTGNVTYLVTPVMDFSGLSYVTLSFWYINTSWAGDIDEVAVCYRVNGGAWNELFSTTDAHSSWSNKVIDLPNLAANYQIGFRMTDNYGYGVGIDDVCFTHPAPNCTPRTASISGCPSSGEYLVMGNNLQLTGSTSAGGGTVTWSSSNTSVATVSNTGLVTPVAPGDVTITYSRAADDTYCSASTTCDITVRQCSAANTIILDDDKSKEIVCGQTYCFYDSGGPDGDYANSEDYTATFESMGEITITFTEFSSEGSSWDYITIYDGDELAGTVLLNRHGGGSLPSPTSFTATSGTMTVKWRSDSSNGGSGWSATITAANCCSTPRTLTINGCPSSDMVSGSTTNLTATVSPAGVGTIEWTSNNTTVAEVSNTGVVTAKAPGSAIITASIPRNGVWCNASATCTINVICAPNSATFALSTASGSLEEGQSIDLSELLTNGTGRTVTWTSSATGTATVNASGVVTGVAAGGPVTITARVAQWTEGGITYCEKTATYTVTVTAINCTGGSWNIDDIDGQTKTIECGKIYCFYDSGGPDGNYENNNENFSCTFNSSGIIHIKFIDFYTESSDELTISGTDRDGTYHGTNIAPGTEFVCTIEGGAINIGWTTDYSVLYRGWKAIITAEGCCETRENVAGFTFCRDHLNVEIGGTLTMPVDGEDAVSPGGAVTYSSSNTSVATVDADGTVHGIAAGNAIITATMAATTVSGVDYCAVKASYLVHVGTPGSGSGCFEIGTGTSTTYYPMPGFYGWQYDVYTYLPSEAAELNNNCNINSVAFYTTTAATNGGEMTIWVKDVDVDYALAAATTFNEYISGATQVYYNSSISTVTGWNTFSFSTSFPHQGGKTLLVAVRGVGCSTNGGCTRYCYYTTATGRYWQKHQDGSDPGASVSGSLDSENRRANIKICYNNNFTPDVMPELTLTGVPSTVVCSPAAISIDAAVVDGIIDAAALSAALPSGLSYGTSTHKITGSLTTGGTYEFDIIAKSDDGCLKDTKHVTITVNELNATIQISNP